LTVWPALGLAGSMRMDLICTAGSAPWARGNERQPAVDTMV